MVYRLHKVLDTLVMLTGRPEVWFRVVELCSSSEDLNTNVPNYLHCYGHKTTARLSRRRESMCELVLEYWKYMGLEH